MSDVKLKDGVVCTGSVKSRKNGHQVYLGRVCSIINMQVVTTDALGYQNFTDDKFLKTVYNSVLKELKAFLEIKLPDYEMSRITKLCVTEMLIPVGSKTRSYDQLIKGIVYRICMQYLKPNIYLNSHGKLSMDHMCLCLNDAIHPNIDKVLTTTKIASMRFLGTNSRYFDSIEIEVGYPSKFSKEMIKKYISVYRVEVQELLYDKLFMAILKKLSLWEKVPDILEIMRFLKLERMQITTNNLLVFKFVIKEHVVK